MLYYRPGGKTYLQQDSFLTQYQHPPDRYIEFMAQTPEQPTPLPQEKETRDPGLAIVATPNEDEKVLFQRSEDGGMTIRFEGKVAIALSPKVAEASGAVLTDTAGVSYGLIPEGAPGPEKEPQ